MGYLPWKISDVSFMYVHFGDFDSYQELGCKFVTHNQSMM